LKYGYDVLFLKTCGQPVCWEKDIGYLRPDSPALMSHQELTKLGSERNKRYKAYLEGLNDSKKEMALAGILQNTYDEQGREFIRAIVTPRNKMNHKWL